MKRFLISILVMTATMTMAKDPVFIVAAWESDPDANAVMVKAYEQMVGKPVSLILTHKSGLVQRLAIDCERWPNWDVTILKDAGKVCKKDYGVKVVVKKDKKSAAKKVLKDAKL